MFDFDLLMAKSFGLAFYKAQEATGLQLPLEGTVLIAVGESDKLAVQEVARRFVELGVGIKAAKGIAACRKGPERCKSLPSYHADITLVFRRN